MRKQGAIGVIAIVVAFLAGYGIRAMRTDRTPGHVLYYVDPMHPSYRSDKPGIAPDCGMPLVAVYEGQALADRLQLAPSAVYIEPERQKLAGIRVQTAGKNILHRVIRTTGRVQVDENRLYRLTAATEGYVRWLGPNPAGTLVKKGEVLATFFSVELRGVESGYISALSVGQPGGDISKANLRINEDQLRGLGMSDEQLHELAKTHEYVSDIKVYSPVDGVVISRGINLQQRFQPQSPLYEIADLSKVWIVADIYRDQMETFAAGKQANITLGPQYKALSATVTNSLPLFDPSTRTFRLRLEASNPDFLLRPDMFVDVTLEGPATDKISVPCDAVIDAGQHKVVYVEVGTGVFEPRQVEIGASYDNQVAVLAGIHGGDRVVTSGAFLVDSESRMRYVTASNSSSQ